MSKKGTIIVFRLLQAAAVCVFLGRSYQHIFWDAPFRTLFWDEALMSGLVEWVSGKSWEEYATAAETDLQIDALKVAFGWFYLLCGLVALFIRKIPGVLAYLLVAGGIALILLAALYCKVKFFSLGQFFEYALQFSAPLLLFSVFTRKKIGKQHILWMKIAIALTFACHGLYAINYYPRPGQFVDMVMSSFSLEEAAAIHFLNTVAVLDFVIAIGVFLPIKLARPVLAYSVLWGVLTSMARLWSHFYLEFWQESIHQWAFEVVYRAPHFLIPLALWYWLGFAKQSSEIQPVY